MIDRKQNIDRAARYHAKALGEAVEASRLYGRARARADRFPGSLACKRLECLAFELKQIKNERADFFLAEYEKSLD